MWAPSVILACAWLTRLLISLWLHNRLSSREPDSPKSPRHPLCAPLQLRGMAAEESPSPERAERVAATDTASAAQGPEDAAPAHPVAAPPPPPPPPPPPEEPEQAAAAETGAAANAAAPPHPEHAHGWYNHADAWHYAWQQHYAHQAWGGAWHAFDAYPEQHGHQNQQHQYNASLGPHDYVDAAGRSAPTGNHADSPVKPAVQPAPEPSAEALLQLRAALRKIRVHIGSRAKFEKAVGLFRKLLDDGSITHHVANEAFQVRSCPLDALSLQHVLHRGHMHAQKAVTRAHACDQWHSRAQDGNPAAPMRSSVVHGSSTAARLSRCRPARRSCARP